MWAHHNKNKKPPVIAVVKQSSEQEDLINELVKKAFFSFTFIGCSFTKSARSSGVFPGSNICRSPLVGIGRLYKKWLHNLLGWFSGYWLCSGYDSKNFNGKSNLLGWSRADLPRLWQAWAQSLLDHPWKGNHHYYAVLSWKMWWKWGDYLAAIWRGVRLSSSAVSRSAPPCTVSFFEIDHQNSTVKGRMNFDD